MAACSCAEEYVRCHDLCRVPFLVEPSRERGREGDQGLRQKRRFERGDTARLTYGVSRRLWEPLFASSTATAAASSAALSNASR